MAVVADSNTPSAKKNHSVRTEEADTGGVYVITELDVAIQVVRPLSRSSRFGKVNGHLHSARLIGVRPGGNHAWYYPRVLFPS